MDLNWKHADTLGQWPRLVIWETQPARDTANWYPREATGTQLAALPLSFAEGCDLIDQVAGLGTPRPSLLLTGDDPLQRSDLCDEDAPHAGEAFFHGNETLFPPEVDISFLTIRPCPCRLGAPRGAHWLISTPLSWRPHAPSRRKTG